MIELPPLPKPDLTSWYGPSSEFNEEPMFSVEQIRSYAEEAVKQEREQCALECERVYGSDERGAKACAVLIRARSQEGQ